MVATGFEVIGDTISLETLFNDYLKHCQELFAHLPDEHLYDWLRDYGTAAKDENSQITHLLLDELSDQEIDLAERLTKTLITLAIDRSDIVWPIILSKLPGAADLQMERQFSAIEAIVLKKPELLLQDWNAIWTVAKNSHFRHRFLLIKVLERVFQDGSMPSLLRDEIAHFKRNYSSIICVSTYRLLYTKPSNEFLEFLKKGALLDFNRQLEGVTDVLKLDKDSVIADLERRLRSQGWNVKDAQGQREEDWEGNVHAQGWPVVWIVPRFHTQICGQLYSAIGEYIEKMKFQDWQVEATWRIIQPSDPEFLMYPIHVKPDDIAPLFVKEKATWFQELTEREDIVASRLPSEGWVCLFESRHLSQDTKYEVPYKSQASVVSTFLDPRSAINKDRIVKFAEWKEEIVSFHPFECLNLEQARAFLMDSPRATADRQALSLPAISLKHNPIAFFGFEYVASLPSFVIQDFDLQFKDFNLYKGTQKVTDFEYWREGYVDEAYSRDILSYGTRLLVRVDFLKELISRYAVQLCRKISEKRLFFKSEHSRDPDDTVSKDKIELIQV